MSAIPTATRRMVLEMKYGKTMRASPQISETTAFCFLPYTKKPRPTEPKSKPQRSDDVLTAVSYMAYRNKISRAGQQGLETRAIHGVS